MALVQDQILPVDDDFDALYRQVLFEAFYPESYTLWGRVGKITHGRLPAEQGISNKNLSPRQVFIRTWFSNCAHGWSALLKTMDPDPTCDGRLSKDDWQEMRSTQGYPYNYYCYFMHFCLPWAFSQECLPPDAYTLNLSADLSSVKPGTYYYISCDNNCGSLELYDGAGSYSPTKGWLAPMECGEGQLIFHDANGATGCLDWTVGEGYMPMELDTDETSTTINPAGTAQIVVKNGVMPALYWTTSKGYYFDAALTEKSITTSSREVTLYCASGTCGVDYDPTATVIITDTCVTTVSALLRNTSGQWGSLIYDCWHNNASYYYYIIIDNIKYQIGVSGSKIVTGDPCSSGGDCENKPYCAPWLYEQGYNEIFDTYGCFYISPTRLTCVWAVSREIGLTWVNVENAGKYLWEC